MYDKSLPKYLIQRHINQISMSLLNPTVLAMAGFIAIPIAMHFRRLKMNSTDKITAIASALGVVPHPEGGFFVETYRSGSTPMVSKGLTASNGALIQTDREGFARNHMTSIIFMATSDARVLYFGINKSDHVHYYHGGDSYTYIVVHSSGDVEEIVLGRNLLNGEKLQIVFPAGCYKAGYLNGEHCLIGEGVSPGFDFRDFQFVDEEQLRSTLCKTSAGARLAEKYVQFVKPDRRRNFDDYYDK